MAPAALQSSILRPAPSPVVGIDHARLLSEIIENLPIEGEAAALGRELRALARERDPELLAEALLSLAGRQVRAGHAEDAARLFPALHRLAENPALPATLRQRIEGQLAGFQGQGSVGQKVEHHVQNFFHEAMHPATLAGFAFGAGAFQSARLLALSRLSVSSAGFFTRGLGARFLGGVAGWSAEVPALTLGSRAVRALMGERVEWNRQALGQELAGTAITLGLMRMAGYGARRGFETVHGLPASGQSLRWSGVVPFTGPAFQQGAMLGSLMLAHDLEARLGLRPATDLAGNFSASLLTLFQFQVGGRIFHELQPRGFARAIQTAEQQSQNLSGPRFTLPRFEIPAPAQLRIAAAGSSLNPELANILTMAELPNRLPPGDTSAPEPRPRSSVAQSPFQFRGLVEGLPDPMIVTDSVGRVIYLNRAARQLAEGTPLAWLQGKIEDNFRPVEGEEGVFAFSRGANDTSYWSIRSRAIEENDGYQMHHFSDLTQLRHWQEVAALSQMKANLAEELVHDAGNLVASAYQQERVIEGIIDNEPPPSMPERPSAPPGSPHRFQLTGRSEGPEFEIAPPVRSTLFDLYKKVRDLGAMLGDTLEAFQYSKKLLVGSTEVRIIEVETLLAKALRLNEPLRQRHGVRLVTNFGDDSPIMMGEESPLLSAILNLCINACHAMPQGGDLRVRTFAENGTVTIEIQDSGVGIAPENLPHIFEPHFTTKEHSGGTGMGLPSVKVAIVRIHRGQVEVESEVGTGTTFRLLLPQTRSGRR